MAGKRPTHRIIVQHDDKNDKDYTEVGAMWAHSKGGGFGILIKAGVSISSMAGARVVAFPINDDNRREDEGGDRREDRDRPRDERGGRGRDNRDR